MNLCSSAMVRKEELGDLPPPAILQTKVCEWPQMQML